MSSAWYDQVDRRAAAARLRTPIAICTTLKRPGSTRAPGNSDAVGKVQILAIDVGLRCREGLARRFEPTRDRNNLGALDETLQHGVGRASLRDSDLHADYALGEVLLEERDCPLPS